MIVHPKTVEDVQEIVRSSERIKVYGGCTKPALSTPVEGADAIEICELNGVSEYQPEEYTFTAYAGTTLQEVNRVLEAHHQYLPFDPPLVQASATLGGTVAAGLSGPGRYRSGGVRDFLLGVRFVDGTGELVRGGGKVVKNAAGFDLPKLMVGSLGGLGILVELTFKVFPVPAGFATQRRVYSDLEQALAALREAALARVDLEALDLESIEGGYQLWARLSGSPNTFAARLQKLDAAIGGGEVQPPQDEPDFWRSSREFSWVPQGWSLIKLPLTPRNIPDLERGLSEFETKQRYSVGGQVAWIALAGLPTVLAGLLQRLDLSALVLWGATDTARIGERKGRAFYDRIRSVLDPNGRFVEV